MISLTSHSDALPDHEPSTNGLVSGQGPWTAPLSSDYRGCIRQGDGSASLAFALRGNFLCDVSSTLNLHPPIRTRENELSAWSVPRSYPSVGEREHGIDLYRRGIESFDFFCHQYQYRGCSAVTSLTSPPLLRFPPILL